MSDAPNISENHNFIISIVSAVLSFVAAIFASLMGYLSVKASREVKKVEQQTTIRDNVTDDRVDLIWKAQLRRGEAEAEQKGLIVKDNAMAYTVPSDIRKAYAPIAPFLKQLRKQYPEPEKFSEQVEHGYGEWLSEHICKVIGMSNYACLRIAVSISEESEPLPQKT